MKAVSFPQNAWAHELKISSVCEGGSSQHISVVISKSAKYQFRTLFVLFCKTLVCGIWVVYAYTVTYINIAGDAVWPVWGSLRLAPITFQQHASSIPSCFFFFFFTKEWSGQVPDLPDWVLRPCHIFFLMIIIATFANNNTYLSQSLFMQNTTL